MKQGRASSLGNHPELLYWAAALIAVLVGRTITSYALASDSPLLSYGGTSYFLLLLLATGLAVRNGTQNRLGSRSFWVFLAMGCGFWALDQAIFQYHEFVVHTEVPDKSIADPVLFLHVVLLMGAVTTLPGLPKSPRKLYSVLLNCIRQSKPTVDKCRCLAAQAAGVSSAMRWIGEFASPGRTSAR
jgi:hypothetical protein